MSAARPRPDLTLLVGTLIILLGAGAVVWLGAHVTGSDVGGFDARILQALRSADDPMRPIGPRWAPEVGRDLTALGSIVVLSLVTLAAAGALAIQRKYHAMWLVLASAGGGMALSTWLKEAFGRPRPDVVPHLMDVFSPSFPSGHALGAAVVYLTLGALLSRLVEGRYRRAYIMTVALTLTALVGLSRLYLGVHYPTDVLAGWVLGLVWALACWLVERHLQRRGMVEPPSA